jgi:hypothetical protein
MAPKGGRFAVIRAAQAGEVFRIPSLRRGALRLQEFFHVPASEQRDEGFNSGNPIDLRMLGVIDFVDDVDRHISFTRQ